MSVLYLRKSKNHCNGTPYIPMTCFVSDIHGEYDLFLKLLDKLWFSESDTMYVFGELRLEDMQEFYVNK